MKRFLEFLFLSVVIAATSSCNRDEVLTTDLAPEIILEGNGIYEVCLGYEVRLAPDYKSADNATFEWRIDDDIVCQERAYVHYAEAVGSLYVTLTVTTSSGSDTKEMRIDVRDADIPTLDIVAEDTTVAVGFSKRLVANVRDTAFDTTISWSLNGESVGSGEEYLFEAQSIGSYTITARAENLEGSSEDSVTYTVVAAEDMPFGFEFAKLSYHTVAGRNLLIVPDVVSRVEGVEFCWELNDTPTECCTPYFVFRSEEEATHSLSVTATLTDGDSPTVITHHFEVEVYGEGRYRREADGSSSHLFRSVVEYMPAPGQFIGDQKRGGFTGNELTTADAIDYAERRLQNEDWVSLGAFGGYIVVDFDHSIANGEGYDIAIRSNSFDGSSEPGVVWVMQDENGNGIADDSWYELRGSEWGAESTIHHYEVTYYRPSGSGMAVQWEDNIGGSGTIDYLESFHSQDYYYPSWIAEDSYTLVGTRLEARNYDKSGNGSMWVQPAYDWGYADNCSTIDCQDAVNSFDIANAVDCLGESIELDYIDFVKVQCAVQAKSGWVGELSTEVCNFWEIAR